MTKRQNTFSWDNVSLDEQRRILGLVENNGHSVWKVEYFTDNGISAETIAPFVHKQVSDGTYKGTTWDAETGQAIEPVAVYGLDVLSSLASHYGLSSGALGRGFRARDLTRQIDGVLRVREELTS